MWILEILVVLLRAAAVFVAIVGVDDYIRNVILKHGETEGRHIGCMMLLVFLLMR